MVQGTAESYALAVANLFIGVLLLALTVVFLVAATNSFIGQFRLRQKEPSVREKVARRLMRAYMFFGIAAVLLIFCLKKLGDANSWFYFFRGLLI
ncbi:MAG: hypothetical protein K8H87_03130 [Pseudorhodoplanes sp.]|nr:hypothetical protein [Pseudorhodoplanes sp.]